MALSSPLFVGIAAFVIVLAGVTVAFVPLTPIRYETGSTTTSVSVASPGGLALRLDLNASSISTGESVSLSVAEWNSLDEQNVISSSNDWPVQGLGVGPCGALNYPFGFAILYGYYNSSAGLSSAQKAQIYEPGTYSCPLILSGITAYSFYPLSDNADVMGSCDSGPCFSLEMNSSTVISGYWNGGTQLPLPSGSYTVVVGDEWGALLLGHFEVNSAGLGGKAVVPAGTRFQVSSSYDCVAGHNTTSFEVQNESVFSGGFISGAPGVTLYVVTTQQASVTFQGHPSTWVYTTGLGNSTTFSVILSPGSYLAWIEGADMNCGSSIVMPLEALTTVNVTQAFVLSATPAGNGS